MNDSERTKLPPEIAERVRRAEQAAKEALDVSTDGLDLEAVPEEIDGEDDISTVRHVEAFIRSTNRARRESGMPLAKIRRG